MKVEVQLDGKAPNVTVASLKLICKLITILVIILFVQFKVPIYLPGEKEPTKQLNLAQKYVWKGSLIWPHLKFKYNGKTVRVPYTNIAVYWEK